MRFSLVIAAHNEGAALWKTVASCIETCSGLDYEIVVVDDASFDDSLIELQHRFPNVRILTLPERLGASPAKALGAQESRGEVLVFLDGHCKPEGNAIERLVEGVEQLQGQAILTPTVAALNVERWSTSSGQLGHGYFVNLEDLHCGWLPLSELEPVQEKRRQLYESPALIGCALAISRQLYDDLQGFDRHMRLWGVEDLDFGLKCWLMGYRILHDPEAVVGHRFRKTFDNYRVPLAQLAVNQLRMARKNFTDGVWSAWLASCRERYQGDLPDYPEGLWARIWELFQERRESVEHQRSYLLARRRHDEFWYAAKFGLGWPRLFQNNLSQGRGLEPPVGSISSFSASSLTSPSPSPSPPPPGPQPPPTPPCEEEDPECPCQENCSCESSNPASGQGPVRFLNASEGPVKYVNGQIVLHAVDLTSSGFGSSWSHQRSYDNQLSSSADLGQGYHWLVFNWPYLVEDESGNVTVVRSTDRSLWFGQSGGQYTGKYGAKSSLVHDAENGVFVLTSPGGQRQEYYDFTHLELPGLFVRQVARGGEVTEVFAYTDSGRIQEIRRSGNVGASLLTEAFVYQYDASDRVTSVLLRRQLGAGAWQDVRQAVYEYYNGTESFGSLGDLKRVRIQVPTSSGWTDSDISYYRYYTSSDLSNGFIHGLKFVVEPTAYARMLEKGLDPLTISDEDLAKYADNLFQYDGMQRVVLERIEAGSRTFTFEYTEGSSAGNPNDWATRTKETRPDNSVMIVYSNSIGQALIQELQSGSDSWIEAFHYDTHNRLLWRANRSAVISYNDSQPDLAIQLRASSGLIETTEYYSTTGSGAAAGYVSARKLQNGSAATPVLQQTLEYAAYTVENVTIHPVSKQTVYRNEAGTDPIQTTYDYSFYSGTFQIQQTTTTLPVVSSAQNGTGVAATRKTYQDTLGRTTWSMDERGFINHYVYDLGTGAILQQIQDVNTSIVSGAPAGWTSPTGGGLNLVTDYQHDELGRITETLGPLHSIDIGGTATSIRRANWNVYDDVLDAVYSGSGYFVPATSTYTLINPVSITVRNPKGRVVEQIQAVSSSTSGSLASIISAAGSGSAAFPQSSYTRWHTFQYTNCCKLKSERLYYNIPSSGIGTEGVNYNQTTYGYDKMNRRNRTLTPGGTITRLVHDVRGLVLSQWVGTSDDGGTLTDPSGGGSSASNNMVVISESEYDQGQDGGDGNLTRRTLHVDATNVRVTRFAYDWRNRSIETDGEIDYFEKRTYDNLNRLIKTERYNTTATGNLLSRAETLFDDRSRVYRTIQYGVNPSTGAVGNALTSNVWFDASGNAIQSLLAGSKLFTKTTYDSLGRSIALYSGYTPTGSTNDPTSVAGDVILEQLETLYDAASNTVQTTNRQRYHNAPDTQLGALANPASSPKARLTYSASYQDALGREIAVATYGTNGGSSFTRSATIPARSDTVLITSTAYNSRGEAFQSIDPSGKEDRTIYDDAGRQIEQIENYQATPSSGSGNGCAPSNDENITVQFTYNSDGQIHKRIVLNTETGDQTTEYIYGTTLTDSDLASNLLLREEIYPDSASSSDRVKHTYNRQSEPTGLTDQNGSVHAFNFDLLGRRTQDRITTLGSGVDGALRRIETGYDVRGNANRITSFDSPNVGSGTVVNEVKYNFNDFNQSIQTFQSHSGAVNSATTPSVQVAFASGSANTIRQVSITYPNGRTVTSNYGSAGSITDSCGQVASLIDSDGGSTHLADYLYLGLGTVVQQDSTQANLRYTLIDLAGSNDPGTGDIYAGLDRFSRIKDLRWRSTSTNSDLSRIRYGYDRASSRIWRENPSDTNRHYDWLYSNDGMHRLHDAQRGQLNAGHTAITSPQFGQCWTLDETGNWQGFRQDDDGNGSWDLIQARTSNPVNEITDIDNTTGSSWSTPAYDANGNTTLIPRPDLGTNKSMIATWDAWNRLVKLVNPDNSQTLVEFAYDGRNLRIVNKEYASGTLSATRHLYYTDSWQALEERVNTSTAPERQHVWGIRYIDDLVLRDRHTNADGTLDERLYHLPDANWNVTAVVDTSGSVQERIEYTPYGQLQFLAPSFGLRSASSYDIRTTYTSRECIPEIKLYDFRNRWYDPGLGRFYSRDPIKYKGSNWNLFAYVDGSPQDKFDPTGLAPPRSPAGYGNYCGPTRAAICMAGPGGTFIPAPGQPAPIDALDAACMVHDCCLAGPWEVLSECFKPVCNPAFCASMAAFSCGATYTDPQKLYDCQYMKWKAMALFCPGPTPPSNTL